MYNTRKQCTWLFIPKTELKTYYNFMPFYMSPNYFTQSSKNISKQCRNRESSSPKSMVVMHHSSKYVARRAPGPRKPVAEARVPNARRRGNDTQGEGEADGWECGPVRGRPDPWADPHSTSGPPPVGSHIRLPPAPRTCALPSLTAHSGPPGCATCWCTFVNICCVGVVW